MKRLMREKGQGIMEYALIIAFIAVLLISALALIQDRLSTLFSRIASGI
jgi:Flp pilus assembly pilin Flp